MVKFVPFALFAILSASSAIASPTDAAAVMHRRRHHQKHAVVARAELEALAPIEAPVPSVSRPRAVTRRKTCKPRSDDSASSDDSSEADSVSSSASSSKSATASSTKTKTSSASESTSTSDSSDNSSDNTDSSNNGGGISGGSGSAAALFPVTSGALTVWTTASDADGTKKYSLTKDTLGVFKQSIAPKYTTYDGKDVLLVNFPKGSTNPGNPTAPVGGVSFYAQGPTKFDTGNAVLMSYRVYFEQGFGFRNGGKMPGLFIGTSMDTGVKCSGGRYAETCASSRLMWRQEGAGEIYAYLQQVSENHNKCGKAANGPCDSNYGSSMGRGTWSWDTGRWVTVAQYLELNDASSGSYKANGKSTVYIDGKVATTVTGLVWRRRDALKIQGMQIQTFFGGHDEAEWGSPKTQKAYFADFGAATFN